MAIYASSTVLFRKGMHRRDGSSGIGGSGWPTRAMAIKHECVLYQTLALPSPKLSLTFLCRRPGHKIYPKRKLGDSDEHEHSHYTNVFPGYGVHPVTMFSCINSESLNNRRNPT